MTSVSIVFWVRVRANDLQITIDCEVAIDLEIRPVEGPSDLELAVALHLVTNGIKISKNHACSNSIGYDLLRNEVPLDDDVPSRLDLSTVNSEVSNPRDAKIPSPLTYPQLTFPLMSIAPYASILSSTVKSPWSVMLLPDLTDPETSSGPWSETESSLLTDLVLRTERFPVEPWNPEELPAW